MKLNNPARTLEPVAPLKTLKTRAKSGPAGLPACSPGPRFLLGFHPRKFRVLYGAVLPALFKYPIQGGAEGISIVQDEDGDEIAGLEGLEERCKIDGVTLLTAENGIDDASYQYQVRAVGGKAHLEVWQRPIAGSPSVSVDSKAHEAFLRHVVEKFNGPDEDVLYEMRGKLKSQLRRALNRVQARPGLQVDVDRIKEELAVVERALGIETAAVAVDPRVAELEAERAELLAQLEAANASASKPAAKKGAKN